MNIDIDPAVAAAIWATVFVLRGLIPKGVVNLDGKVVIYGLVLVASVFYWYQTAEDNTPNDTEAVVEAVITILTTGIGAIMLNGAASASGLSPVLRRVVTINGKINS